MLTFGDGTQTRCDTMDANTTSLEIVAPIPGTPMMMSGEACKHSDLLDGYLVWEMNDVNTGAVYALDIVGLHIAALNTESVEKYMGGKPGLDDEAAAQLLPEELRNLAHCFSQEAAKGKVWT